MGGLLYVHASFPCHAQHLFHPNHFCTRASHIIDRLASLFGSVFSKSLDYIKIKMAAIPFLENRITALYSALTKVPHILLSYTYPLFQAVSALLINDTFILSAKFL